MPNTLRAYDYTYDPLNRLKRATYEATQNSSPISEDFSLTGNDNGITYDTNGSMIYDGNKGITNIEYNHLNLPNTVKVEDGTVEYIYDAAGIKLQKIATINGKVKTTDYIGGFVYEDNVLQFMHTAEGRALTKSSGIIAHSENQDFVQEYHYKDHLGNLRAAVRLNSVYLENFDNNVSIFDNADQNRIALNSFSPEHSQLLTGEQGKSIAASITLIVKEGETFTASVLSKYYISSIVNLE